MKPEWEGHIGPVFLQVNLGNDSRYSRWLPGYGLIVGDDRLRFTIGFRPNSEFFNKHTYPTRIRGWYQRGYHGIPEEGHESEPRYRQWSFNFYSLYGSIRYWGDVIVKRRAATNS